jgi:hypothetical protein
MNRTSASPGNASYGRFARNKRRTFSMPLILKRNDHTDQGDRFRVYSGKAESEPDERVAFPAKRSRRACPAAMSSWASRWVDD